MNSKTYSLNQIASIKSLSSEEIYQEILQKILDLSYEPGRLLSENQMTDEYRVSRTVIRAVFARLQQTGFLEVYPQRGTFVSLIDLNYISDILMLRTALEKEIIYELISSLPDEELEKLISKLEENMEQQRSCMHEKDYHGLFPKLDSEFHHSMIHSAHRDSLMAMISPYMAHLARWRNFDVSFGNRVPALIAEHQDILTCLKQHDILATQNAMAKHLDTINGIAEKALQEYPEYFIKKQ